MRARDGRWSGWLVMALGLSFLRACSLVEEPPASGPCAADPSVCDDGSPCTVDICATDGYCDNVSADELVPDDGNPCTEDRCVEGVAQNTIVPDGTACGLNGQLVCTGGKCLCTSAGECGVDTECQTFACTADGCQSANVANGTFVDGAEPNDCKQRVCDGAGKVITVVDLTDAGPDPAPGDCRTNACEPSGKLVSVPALMDFPADMVAGDCKRLGCTMEGNVVDVDAPDDAPLNDNNPCTIEGCNGGTPIVNEPANEGMLCGGAATCGPSGSAFSATTAEVCAGGSCTSATMMSCGLYTCNGTACHTSCMDNAQCVPGTYCDNGQCKPQSGFGNPCSSPAQCANGSCADGFCCNTACNGLCEQCDLPGALGVCSPVPMSTDPDNDCPGTEVCNGSGQCKKPIGGTCASDAECLTAQCEDGFCCNSDCAGDCRTCNQTGSLGTCKDVPLNQTSGACSNGSVCNGSGSCKKLSGQLCSGGAQCLSGFCPNESGSTDVCCDTACNTNCKSCIGARTVGGVDGVCDFVKAATDPNDDCAGTCNMATEKGCCNGAGVCVPP